MTVTPTELLERLAVTLRQEIGPAVNGAYPRTQAFMAAVVLEKLAQQLALAPAHEHADATEIRLLFSDLDAIVRASAAPPVVRTVIRDGVTSPTAAHVCRVIDALYAHRDVLGATFTTALARVRVTLRARVDRQMEYAR
jgi:hypothetical protein